MLLLYNKNKSYSYYEIQKEKQMAYFGANGSQALSNWVVLLLSNQREPFYYGADSYLWWWYDNDY